MWSLYSVGGGRVELLTPYIWCSLFHRVGGRISLYRILCTFSTFSLILYQEMKRKSSGWGIWDKKPCTLVHLSSLELSCVAKVFQQWPLCGVLWLRTLPASSQMDSFKSKVWDWEVHFCWTSKPCSPVSFTINKMILNLSTENPSLSCYHSQLRQVKAMLFINFHLL